MGKVAAIEPRALSFRCRPAPSADGRRPPDGHPPARWRPRHELVDLDGAIAVGVGANATVEGFDTEGNADGADELVDVDVAVFVAVAGAEMRGWAVGS